MDIVKQLRKDFYTTLARLNQKQLNEVIALAADYYYNSGEVLITDSEYDMLVDKLKIISPCDPLLVNVGAPVPKAKVKLPYHLGSMEKVKMEPEVLARWKKKFPGPYVLSDKLDGVSCLLVVKSGRVRMYTRGNGDYGRDISYLFTMINTGSIDLEKDFAVRGELVVSKESFEKFRNDFTYARAMVCGITVGKEANIQKKHARAVDFVAFELIEPVLKPSRQMTFLEKTGFNVVDHQVKADVNIKYLDKLFHRRKEESPYECDGIIVRDNRIYPHPESGNPAYAFAYKGETPVANVVVEKVIWRTSKDNVLVPRVKFETVLLSDAELSYATAYNAAFIKEHGIGPGAEISIIRSGGVIPKIINVNKKVKPSMPKIPYVWGESGVHIYAVDSNEEAVISGLVKFMRDLGVDNVSEGLVTKLVAAGYDTIPKIFRITERDLLKLEGFGPKLAAKINNNLHDSFDRMNVLDLMVASNIFGRGMGRKKLQKVLDTYPDIVDKFDPKRSQKWQAKINQIDGLGKINARQIVELLPVFIKFLRRIEKIQDIQPYRAKTKSKRGRFVGETVVFTGFRNAEWRELIESEGGAVRDSVSSNTTLLVHKDGDTTNQKYLKAKQLGTKVLSKTQFEKKYV